ncbi:MAG: ceramidase domain-containing protein [Methylococcales bacterium]|nr:ceramidase domain-containing protein [Methylococcales bacterium]
MIDLYCERLDSSFWAEPINALTNFAFIIAAWAVWKHGHRLGRLSYPIWVLIGLMVSIGIGSFLFHTYATNFTRFLDVLPVLLFQFVFMWVYIRRIIQVRMIYAIGLLVVYIFFALLGRQFPHLLNGSFSYIPAILLLLGLGLYHLIDKKRERFILLVALAVFSLALFFRTIDTMICFYFPIGTHFLWHIINGVLVYLSARALMLNLPKKAHIKS